MESNPVTEMVMEKDVLCLDDLCAQGPRASGEHRHCSGELIWENDDNFIFFITIFLSYSIFILILSIQHYILLSITRLHEDTVMILLLTRILE